MEIGPQTDSMPTRATLLGRLRNLDDACSWKEFFERYENRVTRIARSQGLNVVEAEDVAQEVFKRVARVIGGFELTGRPGSFRSWLFKLTRWRATDQLRERGRFALNGSENDFRNQPDATEHTPTIERVPAPSDHDDACEAEDRRHIVSALLKQVERAVTPKQLQIFQLLVLDEAEPAKVAKLYGMSLSAIYVTKHRVAARLREEVSRMQLPQE